MPGPKPKPAYDATWTTAIADWKDHITAGGLMPESVKTRVAHITRLSRGLATPLPNVTIPRLRSWAAAQKWAAETRRSNYQSFSEFFTHALPSSNPAICLGKVRRSRPFPRPIGESTLEEGIANAEPRTRLMLELAAYGGLRRGELSRVHRHDLDQDLIGWTLTVHGKGGKDRPVPLENWLANKVLIYFAGREGWLFESTCGGPLRPDRFHKLARKALPEPWTLHTLRHRFATRAFAGERDLIAVSQLLGHSSVATTQIYVQPPLDALRNAVRHARPHPASSSI